MCVMNINKHGLRIKIFFEEKIIPCILNFKKKNTLFHIKKTIRGRV